MQMPLLRRDRNPAVPGCEVPNVTSEYEREEQRQEENRKENYGQRSPFAPSKYERRRAASSSDRPVWNSTMLAGSELTGSLGIRLRLRFVGNLAV